MHCHLERALITSVETRPAVGISSRYTHAEHSFLNRVAAFRSNSPFDFHGPDSDYIDPCVVLNKALLRCGRNAIAYLRCFFVDSFDLQSYSSQCIVNGLFLAAICILALLNYQIRLFLKFMVAVDRQRRDLIKIDLFP